MWWQAQACQTLLLQIGKPSESQHLCQRDATGKVPLQLAFRASAHESQRYTHAQERASCFQSAMPEFACSHP